MTSFPSLLPSPSGQRSALVLIVLPTEYVTGLKIDLNLLKRIKETIHRVPKGSNLGSERVKFWFRKGQTENVSSKVPDRSNFGS